MRHGAGWNVAHVGLRVLLERLEAVNLLHIVKRYLVALLFLPSARGHEASWPVPAK